MSGGAGRDLAPGTAEEQDRLIGAREDGLGLGLVLIAPSESRESGMPLIGAGDPPHTTSSTSGSITASRKGTAEHADASPAPTAAEADVPLPHNGAHPLPPTATESAGPPRLQILSSVSGGGSISSGHKPSPAEAGDGFREHVVFRRTLYYRDRPLELAFREQLVQQWRLTVGRIFIVMSVLYLVGLFRAIHFHRDDSAVLTTQVALIVCAFGVLLVGFLCAALIREPLAFIVGPGMSADPQQRAYVMAHCALLVTSGGLWAAASVVTNEDTGDSSDALAVAAFLVVVHSFSRLMFPYLLASTTIVALIWVLLAFLFKHPSESDASVVVQTLYLLVHNAALLYASYSFEIYRRRSFVMRQDLQRERDQLRRDVKEAREEAYQIMLRSIGLNELEADERFEAPAERAMKILQHIAKQEVHKLPSDVLMQIKQAITYIGNSGEGFKPQIAERLRQKSTKLDDDIQNWLLSLVYEGRTRLRSEDMPPSATVTEPRSSISATGSSDSLQRSVDPLEDEQKQYMEVFERIDEWNLDVFEVVQLTKGRPLLFVGFSLFKKYDLMNKFHIDPTVLRNNLNCIETGYRDIPYHNSTHAADVTQTLHYFLHAGNMRRHFTDLEIIAALVAASIHDYDHPGLNNNFFVTTHDKLALLYNDRSVLENHHLASAFRQILKVENNIVANMTASEFQEFRKTVIEMVLATDLSHHFELLSNFNNMISGGGIDMTSPSDRLFILKMALKMADVSHVSKERSIHLKWTARVTEEFYRQGDEERKRGLPVSTFMDRTTGNVAKSQLGFINFIVRPLLESWMSFLGPAGEHMPCMDLLLENRERWAEELAKQDSGAV